MSRQSGAEVDMSRCRWSHTLGWRSVYVWQTVVFQAQAESSKIGGSASCL